MRTSDDIAIRVRNWFWYWQVRDISGLNDPELDRKCFGNDCGRRRYFEGVRRSGSSPNARALLDGRTVLLVVDSWDRDEDNVSPFAIATENFWSKLWEFLAARDMPPRCYTEYIQQYVATRGQIRLSEQDARLYDAFLSAYEPAIQRGVSDTYRAMLHTLVMAHSLEALAVLVALFREAMAEMLLDQAVAVRAAIRWCQKEMLDTRRIPFPVAGLLFSTVQSRVLSNSWVTESDWRRAGGQRFSKRPSSWDRSRALSEFCAWFLEHAKTTRPLGYGDTPITSETAGTRWVTQNRQPLEAALGLLDHAWAESFRERVGSVIGYVSQASEDLAEVDCILRALPPRPLELPACFYIPRQSRPDKRGDRVKARIAAYGPQSLAAAGWPPIPWL